MGSPAGGRRGSASPSALSDSSLFPTTKNKPLKGERIRWKSDVPLTEAQLRSKREEFWDTAPAFEGKTEIWAALKAAVDAATREDQVFDIFFSLDLKWFRTSCHKHFHHNCDLLPGAGTGNT